MIFPTCPIKPHFADARREPRIVGSHEVGGIHGGVLAFEVREGIVEVDLEGVIGGGFEMVENEARIGCYGHVCAVPGG